MCQPTKNVVLHRSGVWSSGRLVVSDLNCWLNWPIHRPHYLVSLNIMGFITSVYLNILLLLIILSHIRNDAYIISNQVKLLSRHRSAEYQMRYATSGSQGIFYPTPAVTLEGLTDEEVLYDLFLRQISEVGSRNDEGQLKSASLNQRLYNAGGSDILAGQRQVEINTRLNVGIPVEVVYKGRLTVANFVGRKYNKDNQPTNAFIVRLMGGSEISVDAGQVISCWDVLADEDTPMTPEDWAMVTADALQLLGDMSPRKSDLMEFWQIVSNQRSDSLSVDSLDLGIYIFQERNFRTWLNPYSDVYDSKVRALSAAQGYAAAVLLYNDDFHFKRKPSVMGVNDSEEESSQSTTSSYSIDDLMSDSDSAEGDVEVVDDPDAVYIQEGGYKVPVSIMHYMLTNSILFLVMMSNVVNGTVFY